jgi:hypothetical protein
VAELIGEVVNFVIWLALRDHRKEMDKTMYAEYT